MVLHDGYPGVHRGPLWPSDRLTLPQVGGGELDVAVGTAAQLLALTEETISAGDLGLVIDQGGVLVEAQTPGPASTTWAQRARQIWSQPFAAPADLAKRYLFFDGNSWGASIAANNRMIVPYAGEIRKWVYSSSNDPGSTILGTHFDANTTPQETVTDTASGAAGNYLIEAEFSGSSFPANTILSFSADPTNDPGFNRHWIEIEILIPLVA